MVALDSIFRRSWPVTFVPVILKPPTSEMSSPLLSKSSQAAKRPLVVLFGFLGAKERYVQKYAEVVRAARLHTHSEIDRRHHIITNNLDKHNDVTPEVVVEMPPTYNLLSPKFIRDDCEQLMQRIASHRNNDFDRPTFFYCLSNNGAFTFAMFLYHLKHIHPEEYNWYAACRARNRTSATDRCLRDLTPSALPLRLPPAHRVKDTTHGVVFDSSPCDPNPDLFTRGFTSVLSGALGIKPPVVYHPALSPIISRGFDAFFKSPERMVMVDWVRTGLHKLIPHRAAQLYLTR